MRIPIAKKPVRTAPRGAGALVAVSLTAIGAALGAGCLTIPTPSGGHMECGGKIDCRTFAADRCPSVPGCAASPGCSIISKIAETEDPYHMNTACDFIGSCPGPKCALNTSNVCVAQCSLIADQPACVAVHSADVGTAGVFIWECTWSACNGAAKPCGDYTVADCPTTLGCTVDSYL